MDKAIRSAKLTAAGILDKRRAKTAVERAGGQIAPSKYLPDVPRQAHAPGGYVPQSTIAYKSLPVGQAPALTGGTSLGDVAQLASMMGGKEEAAAPQTSAHSPGDGHDHSGMSDAAVQAWGKLTDAYGKPLTVNSAYRDPQQNAAAHGAKDSQHLHGNAYDVDTSNMSYEDRLALADMAWNSGFRGVGFYDNSMHFDVADPRSWGPSHSRNSIPEWAQSWASQRYGYAGGGKVAFMQGNHPAVPDVLYHGSAPKIVKKEIYLGTGNGWKSEIDQAATDRNIAAQDFRTFRPSEHGNYGPGIYLTDNPKTASDYAQGIRADQSEVKPHGQVMKLHVSMKQPFHDDVLKHPSWIDYIKQELTKYDLPHSEDRASRDAILSKLDNGTATVRDIFVRDTPQGTMINQHGQDDVLKTIRNSGYDGIIAHRPDGSKEIVAFQPEQVKSAIGNQGTFDPSNPDMTKAEGGPVVNLGKEKLVRSITKAVADVKSGAHQEGMDQRAHKLHESGHLPLPIGTKVTPPQGWDMPSELHIHGYWQDILHPDQHGYKLKSENGDLYEVQHQMHSGQNPYVFGGGFKAYSGPVRNRAGYSDEAMAPRNPTLPTRTPEQSDQLNKEYDQLFGNDPDMTKATGGPVTDNENFASWFGNSVTHTDGEPHVFYTGTSKDKDFTAFNVGRHGAWFTRDPEVASSYAKQNDSQGYKRDGWNMVETNTASRVIPAYIKAENPYTGEYSGAVTGNYKKDQSEWFDTLRAKGHDAWIPASSDGQLAVALKEPQQIKSIYNNGKFDPNQKHMNKAEGGEVDDPMVGHHNTSGKGVEVASGLGGIPMPSMAISKTAHPLDTFGDITLMAQPGMVTPSRDTNVWPADTYTGRQPRGDEEFSDPKSVARAMKSDPNFSHMSDAASWIGSTNGVSDADETMKTAQLGLARGVDPKPHTSFYSYVNDVRQKLGSSVYDNDHMPGLRAYGDIKRVLYPKDAFTASGNRKKPVDYTLENVMKRMKGSAEAGSEGFNYGPGNFRAIHTPKFLNMGDIKSDRGLIIPKDQMKPQKSQFEAAYNGLVEQLVQATGRKGFRAYDEAADALTEISKGRKHDWFGNVPPELVSKIKELGRHASKMPTEYFEAKSKRAIPLSAFPAALVPKSDPESARRLAEAGVKKVMTYGSPEERVAMYRSQPGLMFKNGGKAMALTSRFTKNGAGVMMSLKSKGK